MFKLETAEHYCNSAVQGSLLSGIVRGGTDILDTVQCLRVRKRIRVSPSSGGRETRSIKQYWGGG